VAYGGRRRVDLFFIIPKKSRLFFVVVAEGLIGFLFKQKIIIKYYALYIMNYAFITHPVFSGVKKKHIY